MSSDTLVFRFAVNVTPKDGILDPQGRAVEQSLPHLDVRGVHHVRVGRRVELTVEAADAAAARAVVDRLAGELLANPMIEQYAVEELDAPSGAEVPPEEVPSGADAHAPAAGAGGVGGR